MAALYPRSLTAYRTTNKYGSVSFDTDGANAVIRGTQLFLNRELWAFDTVLLRKKENGPALGIPTLSFEQGIARGVYANLEFAIAKLGLQFPLTLEVGAFPIENYVFNMPKEFFDDRWGPIHESRVHWRGRVMSLDEAGLDHTLLEMFEAFFEAAGRKRPPNLHNFPDKVPGTPPN